jgi:hypothetical protein
MGGVYSQGSLRAGSVQLDVTSVAGNFASSWIEIPPVLPVQIAFAFDSSGEYSVQFRIGDSAAFNHPFVANVTGENAGNFAYPISAVRLLVVDADTQVTGGFNIPGAVDRTLTESQ